MIKRGVIIGIFLVLFLGLISATPYILFVNPTPSNNSQTTGSSLTINSTITGVSNLLKFVFNWQSTNYSLYDEDLILMLNLNNNSQLGENDTHVYDSSRGRHNGSVVGTAEFTSQGKYEGGFSFDADDEYINMSDDADFRGENFTISLWYNKTKTQIKQFETHGYQSYFLLHNGDLYGVGYNSAGGLGDGTYKNRFIPVKVLGGHNFSKIPETTGFGGTGYFCGLLENGTAYCWGYNLRGHLGNGNATGDETYMNTPALVLGGYSFNQLHLGGYSTCGTLHNGSALCWGYNPYGMLGLGGANSTQMNAPYYVSGGYNFSYISVGRFTICGLLHNGSALCWGGNQEGQVGIGNNTNMNVPTFVTGGYNFKVLRSGYYMACGILHDGSALCWGSNDYGQLGIGNTTDMNAPTYIPGGYNFSDIETTYYGVCGLLSNGSALCWGLNSYGQLGIGNTTTMHSPTYVSGGNSFKKIHAAYLHVCGIDFSDEIYCWGSNSQGQLGKGFNFNGFNKPSKFKHGNFSSQGYSQLSPGTAYSCVRLHNGSALCWGWNNFGQLGIGNITNMYSPTYVSGGYNFSNVSSGNLGTCGLLHNGSALCWGRNNFGQLGLGSGNTTTMYSPTYVSGGNNFSSISVGITHTCGLNKNNSILCWGRNNFGQLGIGNTTTMYFPILVSGGYNFSEILMGNYFSCGLLQNNSILCWGSNSYGQLGNGNITNMNSPTYVSGGYNFKSLSLGSTHVCGILHNGSLLCLGSNLKGELGIGEGNNTDMYSFQSVLGGHNFSSVKLGSLYSCGLLQNGSMFCWGQNSYGQLGIGNDVDSGVPKFVKLSEEFADLEIGRFNSFGILQDGTLLGWGRNNYGQLGFVLDFDSKIPSKGFYKGSLISKSSSSFNIASTYEGDLKFFVNEYIEEMGLNQGYNHLSITYNGTHAKYYLDGELNGSFESPSFEYYPDLNDLLIGEGARGIIDEILMWNRTLTASEIEKVYWSSLEQKNHTTWEFYSTQTLSNVGTYSYSLFALDGTGSFSVLRRIIKYITTSSDESESVGGSPSITVKGAKLQEGQVRQLRAGTKVKLEFSSQGSKVLEVISVDKENNVVKVNVNGVEVEIINGTTEKIDVNNDGFYDLEVSVQDISSTGSARLMFKEIYEAIESDTEEEVVEKAKEELSEEELLEIIKEEELDRMSRAAIISIFIVAGLLSIISSYFVLKEKWGFKRK